MSFLRENVIWIAPTTAILLVGTFYLQVEDAVSWPGLEPPQPEAPAEVAVTQAAPEPEPVPEPLADLDQLNAAVHSAIIEAAIAPVIEPQEVSRTATPDLLSIAPLPLPQVEPVAAPVPELPEVDTQAAVDFFKAAQSRLAVENRCGEDLKALAAQTRVYFPSGGVAGERAGIDAARLVGQVAADCPGFSLRVEGHTDPYGHPVANLRLSLKRAEAVIARIAAMGVDTTEFVAVGLGDTQRAGITGPKSRDYYDRRVEFSVVQTATPVRFSATVPGRQQRLPACADNLVPQAELLRQFYAPGAITLPGSDIKDILDFASEVARCDGARLRIFGHFTDDPGSREAPSTARLRAMVMMGALVNAGVPSDQVLVAPPSASVPVMGQPALPRSRVDFQVVTD